MKNTKDMLEVLKDRLFRFYKKLETGDIDDARKNAVVIYEQFAKIADSMDIFVEDLKDIYINEIKIIGSNWETLKKLYKQLVESIDKDMPRHMIDEEVKSDLRTYQELFKDIFGKIIQDMFACIDTIKPRLDSMIEKQKILRPKVEYADTYLKRKKNRTYTQYKKMIDDQEDKVLEYIALGKTNKKTITGIIEEPSPWAGHYHAWLSNPIGAHRIVYIWNAKKRTVIFVTIDTKKNLKIES